MVKMALPKAVGTCLLQIVMPMDLGGLFNDEHNRLFSAHAARGSSLTRK